MLWNGWKLIVENTGFSRATLLQLVTNEDFPIVWIGDRPTLTDAAMIAWFASKKAGSRLLQKQKKGKLK